MKFYINPERKKGHINKEIYGHFSEHLGRCIYEGIYVGENSKIPNVKGMRKDVVEALKKINIPVLRWPGGCFADEYHWRDGIGPKETRKKMINTHWGGVVEDNSFGTNEFMELCHQLGCKAYINGNLGSGTVEEMSEWVEYLTYDGVSPMANLRAEHGHKEAYVVDYFGVGNENWGCGGNMLPEYYGNLYRRYQTYIRNYNPKHPIYKVACGPNANDYEWTREVLHTAFRKAPQHLHGFMDGLSLHYYTVPGSWEKKSKATKFSEEVYYETMNKSYYMDTLITRHGAIMDEFDPEKKIGLIVDEWGTWYECEPGTNPGFLYQQNTMRDAQVASIHLNTFNKHCDRVKMANLAQMVNVLQAVILTEGEKMIVTPTYHVFDMFKAHMDAELVDSYIEAKEIGCDKKYLSKNVSESVSMSQDGKLQITINNISLTDSYPIDCVLMQKKAASIQGTILSDDCSAFNSFEQPNLVQPKDFNEYTITEDGFTFSIPACSVLHLEVELRS